MVTGGVVAGAVAGGGAALGTDGHVHGVGGGDLVVFYREQWLLLFCHLQYSTLESFEKWF